MYRGTVAFCGVKVTMTKVNKAQLNFWLELPRYTTNFFVNGFREELHFAYAYEMCTLRRLWFVCEKYIHWKFEAIQFAVWADVKYPAIDYYIVRYIVISITVKRLNFPN